MVFSFLAIIIFIFRDPSKDEKLIKGIKTFSEMPSNKLMPTPKSESTPKWTQESMAEEEEERMNKLEREESNKAELTGTFIYHDLYNSSF